MMLKHHKRDFASLQVLLVPDIFIRRHYDFETSLVGNVDQLAVCEVLSASRPRFLHGVADKETGKTSRCPIIEKN